MARQIFAKNLATAAHYISMGNTIQKYVGHVGKKVSLHMYNHSYLTHYLEETLHIHIDT
jgi:hypothetical protein